MESTSDSYQWLHHSVVIRANSQNNNKLDLGDYQLKMFTGFNKVCTDIHDASFQLGLVNSIHSLMASKEKILLTKDSYYVFPLTY